MARVEIKTYRYIDDLTGTEVSTAEELQEVTIAIDGHAVVLDLTSSNARHLRRQLRPYMRAARPAGLTRVKNALQAGKPAWVEKDGLLDEPKPEAPKPPAAPPVEPPKPAPVVPPARTEGTRSLGEIAAASSLTNGAAAILGTPGVPDPRVPDSSETDGKGSGEVVIWAEWAPNPRDSQRRKGEKVRLWCKKKGLAVRPRAIQPEFHRAYKDFYSDPANWSPVPPREDLLTNTSKALADAAQRVK